LYYNHDSFFLFLFLFLLTAGGTLLRNMSVGMFMLFSRPMESRNATQMLHIRSNAVTTKY
jgi:hypothetical protein